MKCDEIDKDIESYVIMRPTEMLERNIKSGVITKEMLEDENFAQNLVDLYIELENKNDTSKEIKGVC